MLICKPNKYLIGMKRIILFTLFIISVIISQAQTMKTHIIQRGETIESIAKKYGITVDDLKKENPTIEKMHYVGMALKIPTIRQTPSTLSDTEKDEEPAETKSLILPNSPETESFHKDGMYTYGGKGNVIGEVNFQFIQPLDILEDLYDGFNMGMDFYLGYRYYPHNNFFVEGMLGYRFFGLSRKSPSMSMTYHCISIPIHAGALLPLSEKFGIAPFIGPRIDIPVKTKSKIGGQSQKEKNGDVGITLDLGADIKFSDWTIRAQYCIGLGGDESISKNLNAFVVGLSFGF